jgi:hypothetical protein
MLGKGLSRACLSRAHLNQVGQVDRCPSEPVWARPDQKAGLFKLAVMVLDGSWGYPEVGRQPRGACLQVLVPAAARDQVHEGGDRPGAQTGMHQNVDAEPPNVPAEGTAASRQTCPARHCGSSRSPLPGPGSTLRQIEERRDLISRPAPVPDPLLGDGRLFNPRHPPHGLQKFERTAHSQPHHETGS